MFFKPMSQLALGLVLGSVPMVNAQAAVTSSVQVIEQAGLYSYYNADDASPYKSEVLSANSTCAGCLARVNDTRHLVSTTTQYVYGGGGYFGGGYYNPYDPYGVYQEPIPVTTTRDFGEISAQAWSRAKHGSLTMGVALNTSPQPVAPADGYGLPYLGADITGQATFNDRLTVTSNGLSGQYGVVRFKGRIVETFAGTPQERSLSLTMSATKPSGSGTQGMIFDKQVQRNLSDGSMSASGQMVHSEFVAPGRPDTSSVETLQDVGNDTSVYMDVVVRFGFAFNIQSSLSVVFDATSTEAAWPMQNDYTVNAWWDGIESVKRYDSSTGLAGAAVGTYNVQSTSLTAWKQSQYTPVVPEPSSVALVLSGVLTLGVRATVQARRRLSRRPETAGA